MQKVLKIDARYQDASINLALDTIKIGKQAFIFVNTKRSAEKVAEDISKKIREGTGEQEKISNDVLKALARPTRQCERLAFCLKKGIAFHHAGLAPAQREIIEDEFRRGNIKIIACTPTLAAGVDLPAFRAIIRDLKRYSQFGLSWIPVLEYMQQAGRAGRPKFDTYGEAVVISASENDKLKITEKYLNGEPEKIDSKLAVEPVLRTYLLSLVASGYLRDKQRTLEFFSKTFWAHQFEDMHHIESLIQKAAGLLEEWGFVVISKENEADSEPVPGFHSASSLDNYSIRPTLIGKRVAELYIDPYTAFHIMQHLRKGSAVSTSAKAVNEISFIQLVCSTIEMRPYLRPRSKDMELIDEFAVKHADSLLVAEPSMFEPEYDEYMSIMKTALFFSEWIAEKDEEYLLEHYNIRPGEISAKLAIADWLLYATEEMARMMQFQPLLAGIRKARFRLQYGIKEELVPLVKLRNIGRVRARVLYNNRFRTLQDLKKADLSTLRALIGEKTAVSVKEQLDQDPEMKKFKIGKRKGQMGMQKYEGEGDE